MSHPVHFRSRTVEVEASPLAAFAEAYRLGWTDGLPIIPPTEECVADMIVAAGRPPDEVIASLPPSNGAATTEKIAINAVMAGCLPEYMPALVATVEAISETPFNLDGVQATTNPAGVALVFNGPVRKQLDINCERNCLGQGWRANATLGRAIRLIMLNVGGGKPGASDKAIHGFPGKYTFCFGEMEEGSPWDPLHVERGFKRQDSTVTVVAAAGTSNCVLGNFLTIEAMLDVMANSMSYVGNSNVILGGGEPLVILTPAHAELASNKGMSKPDVKRCVWEKSGAPLSAIPSAATTERLLVRLIVNNGVIKPCKRPEDIMLVIAGGPEAYHGVYVQTFGDSRAVTKLVHAVRK